MLKRLVFRLIAQVLSMKQSDTLAPRLITCRYCMSTSDPIGTLIKSLGAALTSIVLAPNKPLLKPKPLVDTHSVHGSDRPAEYPKPVGIIPVWVEGLQKNLLLIRPTS